MKPLALRTPHVGRSFKPGSGLILGEVELGGIALEIGP
jgi:hypothetical protein